MFVDLFFPCFRGIEHHPDTDLCLRRGPLFQSSKRTTRKPVGSVKNDVAKRESVFATFILNLIVL